MSRDLLDEQSEPKKTKGKNMKTNRIPKMISASGLALATAILAALALAVAANAQYKAVGDDGIAASPKVRQALNEKQASANIARAKVAAMACPKCKDISVIEVNRQAKGAEILTGAAIKVVATHTCGGCDTKLEVVGTGKARHTVATHTCAAAVANNLTCCNAAALAR
jgi:hypothetical protein